jgi:hypothetical protein
MGRPCAILRVCTPWLATALLVAPAFATTLRFDDTRSLTRGSREIVIGQVESARSYWNETHTRIFTDVTVSVTRSLKGSPGGTLTLTQLGGTVDGMRYEVPGCPAFKPGEEALFFVWRDAKGRAQLNGLAQGKFDIRRDPTTGAGFVQRAAPGFGVRELKRLERLSAGEAAPDLRLDDLIREIQRALAEPNADR